MFWYFEVLKKEVGMHPLKISTAIGNNSTEPFNYYLIWLTLETLVDGVSGLD